MACDLNLSNLKIDDNKKCAKVNNCISIPNGDRDVNKKRESYIDWDDYFMAVAFLAAMRSKDPCSQVGCCIVNEEKKIVGVGYNGMPNGCSDDEFSWKKRSDDDLDKKFLYVCHAELNAILNKNSENVKNCTLYVGLFPCNECAKVIIQSGIKKIFYLSDKHAHKTSTKASKLMFNAAKVEYSQYIPKRDKILIDFNEINWNNMTQLPDSPDKNTTS